MAATPPLTSSDARGNGQGEPLGGMGEMSHGLRFSTGWSRVMRAVVVDEFGAVPRVAELAQPHPGAGEVVVRMRAAALNPFDWKVIDGALRGAVEHRFPLTLGSDGAGVVSEVGTGVTRFRAGDRVYGQFRKVARGSGSFSEYAVVADKAAKLAKLPA